jgi:hypothetical protein
MAVFTFVGAALIGTGGLWRRALGIGFLLLGLAFMARLLRSETRDAGSEPPYDRPPASQDEPPEPLLKEPAGGQSPKSQTAVDGGLEAIEEEAKRREAKRQRLLAFLAPLEAAQCEKDEPAQMAPRSWRT